MKHWRERKVLGGKNGKDAKKYSGQLDAKKYSGQSDAKKYSGQSGQLGKEIFRSVWALLTDQWLEVPKKL